MVSVDLFTVSCVAGLYILIRLFTPGTFFTQDFNRDRRKNVWVLDRKSPQRLPAFEMQFKSLYHAWAYYMNGYLGWESVSAGKNCYDKATLNDTDNCLGGKNMIPSSRRNMILVRHEDYSHDPQKVLAEIFSFATRGVINADKDKHLFAISEEASTHSNYAEELNVSPFTEEIFVLGYH